MTFEIWLHVTLISTALGALWSLYCVRSWRFLALIPAGALISTLWPVILVLAGVAAAVFVFRFLVEVLCGFTLYGLNSTSKRPTFRDCLGGTLGSFR